MTRLISANSTGAQRQRLRRTIAEALRRLAAKPSLDDDARDLAALIVYALREIHAGVERSASVWDGKHYHIKADRLRADWAWSERFATRLERLIRAGDWPRMPVVLAALTPRFSDIQVTRLTRTPQLWRGAHVRLLAEPREEGEPDG